MLHKPEKSNIIIYLFMLIAFVVFVIHSKKSIEKYDPISLTFVIASILFFILLALSLRMRASFKNNLSATLISSVFSIYLMEVLLGFSTLAIIDEAEMRALVAKKQNVPFDRRAKWEVVDGLRSSGDEWYPTISPSFFMHGNNLNLNGKLILPLSGISRAKIIDCNENGYFSTSTSDEYGFNNPYGIWADQSRFEMVFVGDSFTKGSCVRQDEGFVARVRQRVPLTVNLGSTGNGPLVELATIKEYLAGIKLGYVFWTYSEENDLADLFEKEIREPILLRYLDEDDFSQELIQDHESVNAAKISIVEGRMQEMKRQQVREGSRFFEYLSLMNVRKSLFRLKNTYLRSRAKPVQYDINLFCKVISKAKSLVEKGGGKLLFVYLPEFSRYESNTVPSKSSGAHSKADVLRSVESLGIGVIDIDSAFGQMNAIALFPFGMHGHYNAEGNNIVADEIFRYLDRENTFLNADPRSKRITPVQ